MKRTITDDLLKPGGYDILSAVWVFACNDENPLITYEGLRHRLDLDNSTDEVKALVRSRIDLFRPGVLASRMERWKAEMAAGRKVPRWIAEIPNPDDRAAKIRSLTADDVFRSQLRINEDAPRASLEELDWGLRYIERLRKAHVEQHETSAKSWQMWLVFSVALLNVVVTVTSLFLQKR